MAYAPARPCLDCHRPTKRGSRCADCQGARDRDRERDRTARLGTKTQRGYGRAWQRTVKQAIAEQPWCSVCYSTEDLTGDHVQARARGGDSNAGNVAVLCRRCNGRKGARSG